MIQRLALSMAVVFLLAAAPAGSGEMSDAVAIAKFIGEKGGIVAIFAVLLLAALLVVVFLVVKHTLGTARRLADVVDKFPQQIGRVTDKVADIGAAQAAHTEVVRSLVEVSRDVQREARDDHRRGADRLAEVALQVGNLDDRMVALTERTRQIADRTETISRQLLDKEG